MPRRSGTLVLSTVIIAIALLAPLFVAYVADQLRTYTVLEKKYSLADSAKLVGWMWYNTSGHTHYTNVNFVVDGDDIIIPSLPDVDGFDYTVYVGVFTNATLLNPDMLWQAGVVKLVVSVEIPNTQTCDAKVEVWFQDPDVSGNEKLIHYTVVSAPNATTFSAEIDYTTILLSKYAGCTNELRLKIRGNTELAVGPGDYVVISAVWFISAVPFSQEQIDILLLGSGIVMMVCAAFATPYISLKQLETFGRRRR